MKMTPIVWDLTVNLPFLATVAAAIFAAVVWASSINNRLDRLEEQMRGLVGIEAQIIRLDERGQRRDAVLDRIERQLERGEG